MRAQDDAQARSGQPSRVELGITVRVRDESLDDLGLATVPEPVEVGDLVCLEHGPPLRPSVWFLLSEWQAGAPATAVWLPGWRAAGGPPAGPALRM